MTLVDVLLTALLTEAISIFPLYIFLMLRKDSIKRLFFAWASEFKNEIIAELVENPEILMKLLQPVLKKLAKEYGVPEPGPGGQGGTLNIFGIKLPRSLVEMAIPLLTSQMKKKGAEAVASAFG